MTKSDQPTRRRSLSGPLTALTILAVVLVGGFLIWWILDPL